MRYVTMPYPAELIEILQALIGIFNQNPKHVDEAAELGAKVAQLCETEASNDAVVILMLTGLLRICLERLEKLRIQEELQ